MFDAIKPVALRAGDPVRVVSLSSPVDEARLRKGVAEVERFGYRVKIDTDRVLANDGFFAGTVAERTSQLDQALTEGDTKAVICSRGGYGANYLLDSWTLRASSPKIFCGYSDLTTLQIFLWQKYQWVTLYGPMAAAGLDAGAGAPCGYEAASFKSALTETEKGWAIPLEGVDFISKGGAEGILLGGCLTLIYTAIGTPWALDTTGAILLLEDRGMKPWQVDRALMHLKQTGALGSVKGILLGEFPECEGPPGTETVRDVAVRILGPLGVPVIWGAAVGHTKRAMVTVPFGVRARLTAGTSCILETLEPACRAS